MSDPPLQTARPPTEPQGTDAPRGTPLEAFLVALRLGTTSFGGPVAHIGYFRDEYVRRRRWVDDQTFTHLVALCQVIPGPASSQFGLCMGLLRAGPWGALAAWIGFTLPSALLLFFAERTLSGLGDDASRLVRGLELAAFAVVLQAVIAMGRTMVRTRWQFLVAAATFAGILLQPGSAAQTAILLAAALAGWFLPEAGAIAARLPTESPVRPRRGMLLLLLFGACSAIVATFPAWTENVLLRAVAVFWRAGSLVFGGGHVVLPLLEQDLVGGGLVSGSTFLAGYGAAQAVPGPLFTVASFLGSAIGGWSGAVLCTLAVFLPGSLLVLGVLPFWNRLRDLPRAPRVLSGIQAGVVGLLAAALVHPLGTSALASWPDALVAAALSAALLAFRTPPLLIVAGGVLASLLLG
jgi:chromate transporter